MRPKAILNLVKSHVTTLTNQLCLQQVCGAAPVDDRWPSNPTTAVLAWAVVDAYRFVSAPPLSSVSPGRLTGRLGCKLQRPEGLPAPPRGQTSCSPAPASSCLCRLPSCGGRHTVSPAPPPAAWQLRNPARNTYILLLTPRQATRLAGQQRGCSGSPSLFLTRLLSLHDIQCSKPSDQVVLGSKVVIGTALEALFC
jgi:hypothetical protein